MEKDNLRWMVGNRVQALNIVVVSYILLIVI